MDKLVKIILLKLQDEDFVDEENVEIYRFGLECMLLKAVHIVSYLLIGFCMRELLSLVVSGSILILLRRKTGGYHAKTKAGCYIFSCATVVMLCMFNKTPIMPMVGIIGVIVADILIVLYAPIENENRRLEVGEKNYFRRQAIGYLVVVNVMVAVILLIKKCLIVAYWMESGLIFSGVLLALAVVQQGEILNNRERGV